MLQHRFIDSARRHPAKTAIVDCATDRQIPYSQALVAALILARRLGKLERVRIGIMLPTSSASTLAVCGALMAGLTPVMINYSTGASDNCHSARRRCDFKVIVTARKLLERIDCEPLSDMVFIEDILGSLGAWEKALALFKSKLPGPVLKRLCGKFDLGRPAVILFTSGSEKEPKIVLLSQRNLLSNIDSFTTMMDVSKLDRLLSVLPCFHVFGLTIGLWTPLCLGMTVITWPNPLDFKTVAKIIKDKRPGLLVGTPLFLEGYVKQSQPGDFESVQLTVSGADKCPDRLRALYRDMHSLEIFEGYGATETSPVISANPPDANRPGSIGLPIPGTEVRIENYETGEECAPGELGRILVRGDGVMAGYLNDREETHLRIKSGWYDTGDLGYLDEEGYLWHKGRFKRFTKIGGEMISLVAVEEHLNAVTPEEVECCAIELPDARRGSRIVAVTSTDIDRSQVVKRLHEVLPNLAMPKEYVIVREFPRMGSGKTDFRTLTQLVMELQEQD